MDEDLEHYNSAPLKRTLQEVIDMAKKNGSNDKYSCDNELLIKIYSDHVVLDELHLLLRVMHVLLNISIFAQVNITNPTRWLVKFDVLICYIIIKSKFSKWQLAVLLKLVIKK